MGKDNFLNEEEKRIQERIDMISKAIKMGNESLDALNNGQKLDRDVFSINFFGWHDDQIKEFYTNSLKKIKEALTGNIKLLEIIRANNQ